MSDILVLAAAFVLSVIAGYGIYLLGVFHERMRHFEWLRDGWDLCIDHVDWLMATQQPGEDWATQHLNYITKVFGSERPYPVEKEKVSKEK